ncbi:MAG: 1-acyl-sn-glycerol-3-phosphate acyltransferase [Pseudomonadales bacterium]
MAWQTLGPRLPRGGNRITRSVGRSFLWLTGWRVEGEFPDRPQLIVAVAPHSSNFDWILSIAVIWSLGLRASYLAKHSLFRFPLGALLRRLGAIPVDRRAASGLVEQISRRFAEQPQLILGITPEGTRQGASRWRTGFARIACAANVPVLPTILDYPAKRITFRPPITVLGDVDAVVAQVQAAAACGVPRLSR